MKQRGGIVKRLKQAHSSRLMAHGNSKNREQYAQKYFAAYPLLPTMFSFRCQL